MSHKTIEADKDGRVTVYPALYEHHGRGVCMFMRDLCRRLLSSRRK